MTTDHITVVGGGIAGLTAAIACAETGVPVRLHEAHHTLGGRGRATAAAPRRPRRRPRLLRRRPPLPLAEAARLHRRTRLAVPRRRGPPALPRRRPPPRRPPLGVLRAQAAAFRTAPVDLDFHTWATRLWGDKTARQVANAISVVTYTADTGSLSAAFVFGLFQRVLGPRVPAVRWVRGGWQEVIDRMAEQAAALGVIIETGSRVTELPTGGPVIVATELASARALLHDDTLTGHSGDCVLLDIALTTDRRDTLLAFDLDEGGFHESYTMQDDTIAPAGESLYQLQMPLRAGESHTSAHQRLSYFADQLLPDRLARTTFQRTATAKGRTGALDLPGHTWRDRPAVDRGDNVYLAGDMVAAPGMRGEIAINSALEAARRAVSALRPGLALRP
ncbi:NAD(P)-binding protein [Nocardia thailandica]